MKPWTSKRPTKAGQYWFRWSGALRPWVVTVEETMVGFSGRFDLSSNIASRDGPAMADWDGAEWSGPLEPPP